MFGGKGGLHYSNIPGMAKDVVLGCLYYAKEEWVDYATSSLRSTYHQGFTSQFVSTSDARSQSRSLLYAVYNGEDIDLGRLAALIKQDHESELTFNTITQVLHKLDVINHGVLFSKWIKRFINQDGVISTKISKLFEYKVFHVWLLAYLLQKADLRNDSNIKIIDQLIAKHNITIQDKDSERFSSEINANKSLKHIRLTKLLSDGNHNVLEMLIKYASLPANTLKSHNKSYAGKRLSLPEVLGQRQQAEWLNLLIEKKMILPLHAEGASYLAAGLLSERKKDAETVEFIDKMMPLKSVEIMRSVDVDLILELLKLKKIHSINNLLSKLSDEHLKKIFNSKLDAKKKVDIANSLKSIFEDLLSTNPTKEKIVEQLMHFQFLPDDYISDFNLVPLLGARKDIANIIEHISGCDAKAARFVSLNNIMKGCNSLIEVNSNNSNALLKYAFTKKPSDEQMRSLMSKAIKSKNIIVLQKLIKSLKKPYLEWIKLFVDQNGIISSQVSELFKSYDNDHVNILGYLLEKADLKSDANTSIINALIKEYKIIIEDKHAASFSASIDANKSLNDIKLTKLLFSREHKVFRVLVQYAKLSRKTLLPINTNSTNYSESLSLSEMLGIQQNAELLNSLIDKGLVHPLSEDNVKYLTLALLNPKKTDAETTKFVHNIIPEKSAEIIPSIDLSVIIQLLNLKKIHTIQVLLLKLSNDHMETMFPNKLGAATKVGIANSLKSMFEDLLSTNTTQEEIVQQLMRFQFLPDDYISDFNLVPLLGARKDIANIIEHISGCDAKAARFVSLNNIIKGCNFLIETKSENTNVFLSYVLTQYPTAAQIRALMAKAIDNNSTQLLQELFQYLNQDDRAALKNDTLKTLYDGYKVVEALLVSELSNRDGLIKSLMIKKDGELDTEVLDPSVEKKDKDCADKSDSNGYTNVLMLAFLMRNAEVVELFFSNSDFLKNKFVKSVDAQGNNILHYMILSNFPKAFLKARITSLGLQSKDLDVPNKDGITPLMLAVMNNNMDAFRVLIEMGADINAVDERGFSVLSYACYNYQQNFIIEIIRNKNVDMNLQCKDGLNVLDILERRGNESITMRIYQTLISTASHFSNVSKQNAQPAIICNRNNVLNSSVSNIAQVPVVVKKYLVMHGMTADIRYHDTYVVNDAVNWLPKKILHVFYFIYENLNIPTYLASFFIAIIQPNSMAGIFHHTVNWFNLINKFAPDAYKYVVGYLDEYINPYARIELNAPNGKLQEDHMIGMYMIGPFGIMLRGEQLKAYLAKMSIDKYKDRVINLNYSNATHIATTVSDFKQRSHLATFSNYEMLISRYCQLHKDSKRMPFAARVQSSALKDEIAEACAHICNNYNTINHEEFNDKFKNFRELMMRYSDAIIYRDMKDNYKFNEFIKSVLKHAILVSPELYVACLEYDQFRLRDSKQKQWFWESIRNYFKAPNTRAVINEIESYAEIFKSSQKFKEDREMYGSEIVNVQKVNNAFIPNKKDNKRDVLKPQNSVIASQGDVTKSTITSVYDADIPVIDITLQKKPSPVKPAVVQGNIPKQAQPRGDNGVGVGGIFNDDTESDAARGEDRSDELGSHAAALNREGGNIDIGL